MRFSRNSLSAKKGNHITEATDGERFIPVSCRVALFKFVRVHLSSEELINSPLQTTKPAFNSYVGRGRTEEHAVALT